MHSRTIYWLILVVSLSFFSFKNLLRPGYFPMHDDMQVIRLVEMDKCVKDGQFPCRWIPDLGYGYGYPLFNYYGPLPYYVMETFYLTGFQAIDSIKIEMVLTFIFSGIGMFLLGRSLWGNLGGLVSALFYVYAPYRAVDIYSRGAVGEFNALVFLPFIFWSITEYFISQKTKYLFFLSFSFSGLVLTHNITSLIFAPFVGLWGLYLCWFHRKWKLIKGLMGALFLAIGLSGFFLLPVIFEKRLVHVESMLSGYFNYLAHYVSITQLFFSTHWGYGPSEFGVNDDAFFGIGIFHWFFALLALVAGLIYRKINRFAFLTLIIFGISGIASAFMIHPRSVFIWNRIEILSYLQFPWRFLVLVVFFFSLMSGGVIFYLKNSRFRLPAAMTMILLVIIFNVYYFAPESWSNITDKEKTSGIAWEKQVTASIFDYLPIYAKAPPASAAPPVPISTDSEIKVLSYDKGTDWQKGSLEVVSEKSQIQLPLFYFPNFILKVDNRVSELNYNNDLGLVTFTLNKGVHDFAIRLEDTWPRKIGNLLSFGSIVFILLYFIYVKKSKRID